MSGKESKLVGLVGNGTKVGYPVPPGEHTFMVVSEAAEWALERLQRAKAA